MIYGVQRNEMMWANIRTCYWLSGYQSLQCSLCPRWQQTQACIDNGPASSEKSVSNCLWCWPTHRQNHSDIHADGMKTRCPRLQMKALGSSVMKRQKSELNCTVSWAELGYLDDMIQDDERTMTHSDSLETHTHVDTHWMSSWPPGHFLWPWCQTGEPGSPWPSGYHG